MTNDLFSAPFLGGVSRTLSRHVSLATPFMVGRIAGRDRVAHALLACAETFGLEETGTRLYGDQLEGVAHFVRADGTTTQILTVSSCDQAGRVTSVDMYGRPWPQMSLVRERLAASYPDLAGPGVCDLDEDTAGPGPEHAGPVPLILPPFADNVLLRSPISASSGYGREELRRYLDAAVAVHGELKYHAVLGVHGENAIVVLCDGLVRGSVLRLAVMLSLDRGDALRAITFFSRPWTAAGLFRSAMHDSPWGPPACAAEGTMGTDTPGEGACNAGIGGAKSLAADVV
jgi:hypothetical protein